jgi:type II secretory pathway pseudopilin PulG
MKKLAALILLGILSVGVMQAGQTRNTAQSRASRKADRKQQKAMKKYRKAQQKAQRKMIKKDRKNTHLPTNRY